MHIKCFKIICFKTLTRDTHSSNDRVKSAGDVVIYIRKQLTDFIILASTSALITY